MKILILISFALAVSATEPQPEIVHALPIDDLTNYPGIKMQERTYETPAPSNYHPIERADTGMPNSTWNIIAALLTITAIQQIIVVSLQKGFENYRKV